LLLLLLLLLVLLLPPVYVWLKLLSPMLLFGLPLLLLPSVISWCCCCLLSAAVAAAVWALLNLLAPPSCTHPLPMAPPYDSKLQGGQSLLLYLPSCMDPNLPSAAALPAAAWW
jgi:hypothetical protein